MASQLLLEVKCPQCGPLSLAPTRLGLQVNRRREALGEFTCSLCNREVFVQTTPAAVTLLLDHGGRRLSGPAPFELFEPHSGPPLSWDDLLDFHSGLARSDEVSAQAALEEAAPSGGSEAGAPSGPERPRGGDGDVTR